MPRGVKKRGMQLGKIHRICKNENALVMPQCGGRFCPLGNSLLNGNYCTLHRRIPTDSIQSIQEAKRRGGGEEGALTGLVLTARPWAVSSSSLSFLPPRPPSFRGEATEEDIEKMLLISSEGAAEIEGRGGRKCNLRSGSFSSSSSQSDSFNVLMDHAPDEKVLQ